MPHIVIEASPALLGAIGWQPVLRELHRALAESGWAAMGDMKSRVHPIAAGLCGEDPAAQQLIATLTLTNPRPPLVCRQMAEMVHVHLSRAIDALGPGAWTQCCVFLRDVPKSHYVKRQWPSPAP